MLVDRLLIDNMEDYEDYTVLGNDTTNLEASAVVQVPGSYSLEFDKADGAANTTIAGAYRTFTPPLNFKHNEITRDDFIEWGCYCSAVTDVTYAFVRLGESASKYAEWRFAVASMIAGWNRCYERLGKFYLGGTGWDPESVDYMAVGVCFSAEDDTLAGIKVDQVEFVDARYLGV